MWLLKNTKLCFIAIAFLISSCKFIEPTIGNFNIKNIKPKKEGNFIIEIIVDVNNPNDFNIWLKNGEMDIFNGNEKMGTITTIGKVVLKKNKKNDYTITCLSKINPASVLMGMFNNLGRNNKLLTFKGDIRAGVFIFSKKFDIEFDDILPSIN